MGLYGISKQSTGHFERWLNIMAFCESVSLSLPTVCLATRTPGIADRLAVGYDRASYKHEHG